MTTDTNPTKRPVPRKLDQAMIDALYLAIAKGNYKTTAAALVGIDEHTINAWMQLGLQDETEGVDSIYSQLSTALKKAEAEAEAKLVEVVRESAEIKRDWLPAITFLERRHPDRWGRRDRTRVDINEHKEITITHVEYNLGGAPGEIVEGESRELLDNNDSSK